MTKARSPFLKEGTQSREEGKEEAAEARGKGPDRMKQGKVRSWAPAPDCMSSSPGGGARNSNWQRRDGE